MGADLLGQITPWLIRWPVFAPGRPPATSPDFRLWGLRVAVWMLARPGGFLGRFGRAAT